MKKQVIRIRLQDKVVEVNGYVDRGVGIHRDFRNEKEWVITDLATGMGCYNKHFATRKEAEAHVEGALINLENIKIKRPECYEDCVKAFNKLTGKSNKANTEVKTEKGEKKMAKTNTSKKATAKVDTNKALEDENKALKKEIEILKKQIEGLTKVEKINIDTFDVDGYMASRDDSNRITEALVEALENTEGLVITRKGKDNWLYVGGKTEDDTRSRKDIFKAMGFRFSANEKAWFLAPYPLRSMKSWGAKKAKKASAVA